MEFNQRTDDTSGGNALLLDKTVREAITLCADRETLALTGFGGAMPAYGFSVPYGTEGSAAAVCSAESAAALLESAGYTDADGEVIFKKYSQVGELSSLTAQYAEVLHKNTGLPVVITDRDRVISCAGVPKKETVERRITQALENIMENRSPFICEEGGERFHPIEGVERDAAAAFPIIGAGDVSGAVVLLTADEASVPTQTEIKLVQVAASFLGKQMEE